VSSWPLPGQHWQLLRQLHTLLRKFVLQHMHPSVQLQNRHRFTAEKAWLCKPRGQTLAWIMQCCEIVTPAVTRQPRTQNFKIAANNSTPQESMATVDQGRSVQQRVVSKYKSAYCRQCGKSRVAVEGVGKRVAAWQAGKLKYTSLITPASAAKTSQLTLPPQHRDCWMARSLLYSPPQDDRQCQQRKNES
jgi:hypothetical protein